MKITEIFENWEKDSEIDITDLGHESIKVPKLHHKYFQFLSNERLILKNLESEMKKLKLDKYEFYTQGQNEETLKKGWKLPSKGLILKTDIPMYLEADDDIINLSLRIGMQQEKIELLESIIKTIMNRGYNIKAAIDFQKFINGG